MGDIEHLDQDRVDEIIWRNADIKSARQIAEMTGLKPEEVLRRKKELVEEVDDLTIKAIRARLLIDLQSIARKTQEDYDASPYEFKSGLMNSSVAAMKLVLSELNRMDKADESKVETLNNLRVREILRLIEISVKSTLTEIAEIHDLEEESLMHIFQSNLVQSAQEIDPL